MTHVLEHRRLNVQKKSTYIDIVHGFDVKLECPVNRAGSGLSLEQRLRSCASDSGHKNAIDSKSQAGTIRVTRDFTQRHVAPMTTDRTIQFGSPYMASPLEYTELGAIDQDSCYSS